MSSTDGVFEFGHPIGANNKQDYSHLGEPVDQGAFRYRWAVPLLILFLMVFVLSATALGLATDNRDRQNQLKELVLAQLSEEDEDLPVVIPVDQLSPSTAYHLFHGSVFSKYYEGVDGSDCFPFLAFGASQICVQLDKGLDPLGVSDVSIWEAGGSGIGVPGHEHDCSNESWFVVSGSCTWWWDPSGAAFPDFMGVLWENRQTIAAPGAMHMAKGTVFSWACDPGSQVYATFSPGNVNGLIKGLAVNVFGPSPTLPVTRDTVMQLGAAHCTVFRSEALDVVFP